MSDADDLRRELENKERERKRRAVAKNSRERTKVWRRLERAMIVKVQELNARVRAADPDSHIPRRAILLNDEVDARPWNVGCFSAEFEDLARRLKFEKVEYAKAHPLDEETFAVTFRLHEEKDFFADR